MKKVRIFGVSRDGYTFKRMSPLYKGDQKEYVSTHYSKTEDGGYETHWSVNLPGLGCFNHSDQGKY